MACLKKRKTSYYIVEKIHDGKKWRERWVRLGPMALVQARAVLARYHTDKTYLRLGFDSPLQNITFNDLTEKFVTHQKKLSDKKIGTIGREKNHLQLVGKEFGAMAIQKIKGNDILNWCIENGYKPQTIRHYCGAVSRMCKFAIDEGFLGANPMAKVKLPRLVKNPPKHITEDVLWPLMECIASRHRPAFMIMLYTGLRPSECFRLCVKNVDLKKMTLDMYPDQTKTAERGLIPIHSELLPIFQKLLCGKKTLDFLFPSDSKTGHTVDCKKALVDAIKILKSKHKIKAHVTPYMFRHTFATRLLDKTGDIRVVQQLMRHKSIQMTTRYATALDSKLRDAIDSF